MSLACEYTYRPLGGGERGCGDEAHATPEGYRCNAHAYVERAETLTAAYPGSYAGDEDRADQLTDMLADLRHWAQHYGLNFEQVSARAFYHYSAERRGEE